VFLNLSVSFANGAPEGIAQWTLRLEDVSKGLDEEKEKENYVIIICLKAA
jgi:hypothetical protein